MFEPNQSESSNQQAGDSTKNRLDKTAKAVTNLVLNDDKNSVQQIKIDNFTNIYINGADSKDIKKIIKSEQASSKG